MSLSSALETARNSLKATAGQINVASQNMASAQDQNYTRRISYINSYAGSVYAMVRRDSNSQFLADYLTKSSYMMTWDTIANGIDRLSSIHSSDDFAYSPAKLLVLFRDELQTYYNEYEKPRTGEAAIVRARDLVESLNRGSQKIEKLRNDSDADIKISVDHINELLNRFHDLEQQIFKLKASGHDIYGYIDQRDGILKELAQEIGVTTSIHSDGSMTIYGMDGSTLYDKTPRKVTFEPSMVLPAGVVGGGVLIDGVPLSHTSFKDPNGSGNLGGLLKVRDEIAPKYQRQLDEISAALLDIFQGPPSLFLDGGDSSVTGLSGRLLINPDFDSDQGGSPAALGERDNIQKLLDKFREERIYGDGTGISGTPNILKFAEDSISWLEAIRKDTIDKAQYQSTMFMRANEALSNKTGVNIDDEMVLMMQLENTYSATARIISTVGKMLDDLMIAIR
ncbi:MAG: flagellar hook-associated protein 1 FlgK [Candidatus Tokpelaia sp. JSC189]|nr:MAG: flagellar hook-associated protein 1 FlgK [Candidatus Tokpelaia sp. JSC189]